MKNILIATHNKAKLKRYQGLFADITGLKLVTLEELGITLKADEPFSTPDSNSAYKAKTYGELSQLPTIAIDEAVRTNFLPDHEQPGVFVRRFRKGAELSDSEVLNVWREIFATYPTPNRQFIWDFSLSYYDPKSGESKTVQAIQKNSISEKFSDIIDPGYPMSSFLIPEGYTRPSSELSQAERLQADQIRLKPFWEFIKNIIDPENNQKSQ